jgi:hypothetical protein
LPQLHLDTKLQQWISQLNLIETTKDIETEFRKIGVKSIKHLEYLDESMLSTANLTPLSKKLILESIKKEFHQPVPLQQLTHLRVSINPCCNPTK